MDFNTIDWNAMWKEESTHAHFKDNMSSKEVWDKRAESFDKRISRVVEGKEKLDKDDYISKMLAHIEVKPEWTVLDIGCGPGTLAIPLAQKAKSVTALDLSSEMLKHLKANAGNKGLSNIQYLNSAFLDACTNRQVAKHDVVVASRSLMSGDMKEVLSNIISLTGQAAYLTFPVVHLPFDWEVYKAVGRGRKKHPPYIYICNMLYQMGVMANVEILDSKIKVRFSSIEEAVNDLQWRTDPFTQEETIRLIEFLKQKFAEQKGSSVFTHEGYSKWALVWWKTAEQ
jgi:predicted TPR repeat methyltransferase